MRNKKLFFVLISGFYITTALTAKTSQKGNHFYRPNILACCPEYPGVWKNTMNASNYVISRTGLGAEIFDWLSKFMEIGLECAPINALMGIDNTSTTTGWLFLLNNGSCDLLAGTPLITYKRFQNADFLHSHQIQPVIIVIPVPFSGERISAVWKPFQSTVWIVLISSTAIVTATLILLECFNRKSGTQIRFDYQWLFVVGLLLSRAGIKSPQLLKVRLVGGSWGIAALIIAILYGAFLISFIMSPNPEPLVNSPQELADKDEVALVVFKNYAVDITIMRSTDPLNRKLANKLESNSKSRCSDFARCIDEVKTGSSVFIHEYGATSVALKEDFARTGKCNFALAKSLYSTSAFAWMVNKRDPYFETYQQGILQMLEKGLIRHWQDLHQPKLYQCFGLSERKQKMIELRHPSRIGLTNLSGAFLGLLVGYCLALIAMIAEYFINKNAEISTRNIIVL